MSRAIALHHVVHKVSALILLRLRTAKQHFCRARNTSDRLAMENYRNAVRNVPMYSHRHQLYWNTKRLRYL